MKSLSRSASGPGGLSLNIAAANTPTGSTLQPPAAGGLLLPTSQAPATNSAPAQTIFGNTANNQGTAANTQAQAQAPGQSTPVNPAAAQILASAQSMFGNTTNTSSAQQPAGGMFGAQQQGTANPFNAIGQTQQNAPANTFFSGQQANTFGGGSTPAQPTQTPGIFGQAQNQPAQGSNIFGQTQNQPAQGTGMFGQTQPTPGNTLFGQSQAQPAQGNPMFGQGGQNQTSGIFGGTGQNQSSTFGQPANNQQTVPGVQVDMNSVRGTTMFEELTGDGKDVLGTLEAGILKIMSWCSEISQYISVHDADIKQLLQDVKYLERKYQVVQSTVLEDDVKAVQELRTLTNERVADAGVIGAAADNQKLPGHYQLPGLFSQAGGQTSFTGDPSGSDLLGYFNNTTAELDARESRWRAKLREVEEHVPGLENGIYERLSALRDGQSEVFNDRVGYVLTVFKDYHDTMVRMAENIVDVRGQLNTMQDKVLGAKA